MRNQISIRVRSVCGAAVLALGLSVSLAACSGTPDASTSTNAGGGIGVRWSECMRAAGFEVPDARDADVEAGISVMQGDYDEQKFGDASSSCAEQVGVIGVSDAEKQKWARQYREVENCIRENGYPDIPEQEEGTLAFPDYAPEGTEEFENVFMECMQKHSPDTQTESTTVTVP